ncbi:MAG: hypothetical protein E7379_02285 [Clostridiales bacterium]|nr:hypothetical protein [Clostridiales bacterium]
MTKINKLLLTLCACMLAIVPFALTGCFGKDKPVLEIFAPLKTEYYVGEEFDTSVGGLKYTEDGKTEYLELEDVDIKFFNTDTAGEKTFVISYKEANLEVDYTVIEPLQMQDKQVYYVFIEASKSYSMVYLDRAEEVLYVGIGAGKDLPEAVESFKSWEYSQNNSQFSYTESLVDGICYISAVIEIGMNDSNITIIPKTATTVDVTVSYDVSGTPQATTETMEIYNEEAYEAMLKVADKEVYYVYLEEATGYSMLYLDREAGLLYLGGDSQSKDLQDAVDVFMESELGASKLEVTYTEVLTDGKRIVTSFIPMGMSGSNLIITPITETTIEVTSSSSEQGQEPTTHIMTVFDEQAYEAMPKVADKEVYWAYDEESENYSMYYLDREVGVMYIGTLTGDSLESAVAYFLENYVGNESSKAAYSEILEDGKRILSVTGYDWKFTPKANGSVLLEAVYYENETPSLRYFVFEAYDA